MSTNGKSTSGVVMTRVRGTSPSSGLLSVSVVSMWPRCWEGGGGTRGTSR